MICDLLTIAKVAMPADLFAIDPRILNAQDLLAELERRPSLSDVLRARRYRNEIESHLVSRSSSPQL